MVNVYTSPVLRTENVVLILLCNLKDMRVAIRLNIHSHRSYVSGVHNTGAASLQSKVGP